MDLNRIFITGASGGLGEALARRYAAPGVHIGLVARRRPELDRLAAELRERGAIPSTWAVDVTDTAGMAEVAGQFLAEAGGVDLVVANAGLGHVDRLQQGESASVARMMLVNVVGVTNTVIPFLPSMIAQGSGVVCAVGSFAGHTALPGRTAYSASKAAVRVFMDGLRMDLVGTGVHAMTICPGFVHTPMTAGNPEMPFVIEVEPAVDEMVSAIAARKRTFTFPWQMRLLAPLVTRAPEWLLRRVMPAKRVAVGE